MIVPSSFRICASLVLRAVVVGVLLFASEQYVARGPHAQSVDPCAPPQGNPIKCENALTGNPKSEWDVSGSGDASIQGFTTEISVLPGQTVQFKVDTNARAYRIDIYRLGYYAGLGARKVATLSPSVSLPQSQPNCLSDIPTGLIDCGNWSVSASWAVPATAVSGIYIGRLVRTDTGGASHVPFIVRNDTSHSDILFQTSDTTWHAYNNYGGNDLYEGNPVGRAYKVSYNRPLVGRGRVDAPLGDYFQQNTPFWGEYPMVRFLESNGFDVSYSTGVDTARRGVELLEHKIFLSVGHDEYWSGTQRANVEIARDAGVHLAFLSGNEIYWKTRWESSIDGNNAAYRTLVCYKETHDNAKIDPSSEWTGTWRDPRLSPPYDGGRPENALSGTIYTVNKGAGGTNGNPIEVPAAYKSLRFWRNTSIANLSGNQKATLANNTLGYEWDESPDNGFRPAGAFSLSSATENVTEYLLDYGTTYGPGTATHKLTMYRAPSGALVFGAGTVQWSFGLDETHDGPAAAADVRVQQATINLFADMGVQPTTLRSGLIAASKSADSVAPSSAITMPTNGQSIVAGAQVTVSGTAADVGGVVAGVEVSGDGGVTWHPANGTTSWSYSWMPPSGGSFTVAARAVDDSGNLQNVPASVTVSVLDAVCPCSLWDPATTTPVLSSNDPNPYELGVRFSSSREGRITGIRFYKSSTNTGMHTAHLWTSSGTLLATATFANETATGWQTASLSSPVAIASDTTYVASYFVPIANAAYTTGYFVNPLVRGPLTAPANVNGVFRAGATGFPNETWNLANFWVDVIFETTGSGGGTSDTTPPTVTSVVPTSNATNVSTSAGVLAQFSEALLASSVTTSTFALRNAANQLVAASVTYNASTNTATLQPQQALTAGTTYTARLVGGSAGVKDVAGNALASDYTWSFITAAGASCPCSLWDPATTLPTITSDTDPSSYEFGVRFTSSQSGQITGIRFYKSSVNTGTHTAHLWTSSGTLLATATFANETATGWQTATFASPVSITAGTTYVGSYYAPNRNNVYDLNYFTTARASGPLTAPANVNGVFRAGATGFPNETWNLANFWVDVIFETTDSGGGTSDTTPPFISGIAAGALTRSSAKISWTTDEASTTQVEYGTTSSLGSTSTLVTTLVISHAQTLSNLQRNQTYYFRVLSRDSAGNLRTSVTSTFRTSN
jgi:hypothetical protein